MKFDLNYFFSAKYVQWISSALVVLFLVLIIREYSTLHFSPMLVQKNSTTELLLPSTQQESFESVLKASLFGVYVPNDLNESSVKKSMLDVTLVGILLSDEKEESQVIIRSAGGEEKTYRIGDMIPGEAVIKRITAKGVLVERHGTLESLSLLKNDLTFEPAPKPLKEEER